MKHDVHNPIKNTLHTRYSLPAFLINCNLLHILTIFVWHMPRDPRRKTSLCLRISTQLSSPGPDPGLGDADVPAVTRGWVCSAFVRSPLLQADVLGPAGTSVRFGVLPADEKPQCSTLSGSELALQLGYVGEVSGGSLAPAGCPKSLHIPCCVRGFVGQDPGPAQRWHPVVSLPPAEVWGCFSGGEGGQRAPAACPPPGCLQQTST